MIYVNLEGRLGNNLWQIAAAATLAKRLGADFCAVPNRKYYCPEPDNCWFDEYIEPYKHTIFSKVQFVDNIPDDCFEYDNEYDLTQIIQLPQKNVRISGYWQSMRYVEVPVAQQLFAPTASVLDEILERYPILTQNNTCAIVVRRGDYLKHPMQFPAEDIRYYRKCIKMIERNCRRWEYIIISDDTKWCKENFWGQQYQIVENESPLIQLYISSLCSKQILSNSSFAQWGAILNSKSDKCVYYPDPWYGIGMRHHDNHGNDFPKEWIKVRHYSYEYSKGVLLWLKNGIMKYLLKRK